MGPNQLRYVVSGGFLLAAILVAVGTYFAPPSLFEAIQRNDIAEAIELANDQAATLLAEEKAGKVEVGLRERGYVWGGPPSTWTGRLARIGRGLHSLIVPKEPFPSPHDPVTGAIHLTDDGAHVIAKARDRYGNSALHWATRTQDDAATALVLTAIAMCECHVDWQIASQIVKDIAKTSPLVNPTTNANANKGNTGHETCLMLLNAAAMRPNNVGTTPLHWASAANNGKACALLMNAGADRNAQNHAGEAPLHWAVDWSSFRAAPVLLYHPLSPRPDSPGKRKQTTSDTSASSSITILNTDTFDPREYKVHANVGITDEEQSTPLHRASKDCDNKRDCSMVVSQLLRAGGDASVKNKRGRKALEYFNFGKSAPPTIEEAEKASRGEIVGDDTMGMKVGEGNVGDGGHGGVKEEDKTTERAKLAVTRGELRDKAKKNKQDKEEL